MSARVSGFRLGPVHRPSDFPLGAVVPSKQPASLPDVFGELREAKSELSFHSLRFCFSVGQEPFRRITSPRYQPSFTVVNEGSWIMIPVLVGLF